MYKKLFIYHPQSVNETYFEHAQFALRFSCLLFLAAFAALIHAIIPAFFEKTSKQRARVQHMFRRHSADD